MVCRRRMPTFAEAVQFGAQLPRRRSEFGDCGRRSALCHGLSRPGRLYSAGQPKWRGSRGHALMSRLALHISWTLGLVITLGCSRPDTVEVSGRIEWETAPIPQG